MGRKFLLGTLKVGLDIICHRSCWLTSSLTHKYKGRCSEHRFSKRNASSRSIQMRTKNVFYSVPKESSGSAQEICFGTAYFVQYKCVLSMVGVPTNLWEAACTYQQPEDRYQSSDQEDLISRVGRSEPLVPGIGLVQMNIWKTETGD